MPRFDVPLIALSFMLLLGAFATTSQAALPKDALEEAQKGAPELVKIEVQKITMAAQAKGDSRHVRVEVQAKIIAVSRTASAVKVGDSVTIRWIVPSPKDPAAGDWAEPLMADMDYLAYLAKNGNAYKPGAYSASFEELPIKERE